MSPNRVRSQSSPKLSHGACDSRPFVMRDTERGDWCGQIALTPRALPAKEVAFAAFTMCEGEKRDA